MKYNSIEKLKTGFLNGHPFHFVIFTNIEPNYNALPMESLHVFNLKHKDKNTITWTEEIKKKI